MAGICPQCKENEKGYHRKLCDECRDINKSYYQRISENNRIIRNPNYYKDLMRKRRAKSL